MRKPVSKSTRATPVRSTAAGAKILTLTERFEAGRALRKKTPRVAHAGIAPAPPGRDPIALLEQQNRTRVQALVPERFRRMLASPFAFLRGAAVVMAADLVRTPVSGSAVQACGDMHVSNFGVFASAERNLVFAINDFDETLRAPWEWDLKRLCASAVVAARFLGADATGCKDAAREAAAGYRRKINHYATLGNLAVWYARIDEHAALSSLSPKARARGLEIIAKAKENTQLQVMTKLTDLIDTEKRVLRVQGDVLRAQSSGVKSATLKMLREFLVRYAASLPLDRRQLLARYHLHDAIGKVVGVGSVGMGCWLLYLSGNDDADPLFLQVKEVAASVLSPYWGTKGGEIGGAASEGARVVAGQRLIQGAPDIFLGWAEVDGRQFYVRQLRDMKGGVELLPGTTRIASFIEYCGITGWALALAHAKSGDAAMIAGYVGRSETLDDALVKFAVAYAAQTERDYAALEAAAKSGRIRT
jgi:uncharacterized protein (DUF2252 family)